MIAGDNPRRLQPPDAVGHRWRRQAQAPPKVRIRAARILLERAEQRPSRLVKHSLGIVSHMGNLPFICASITIFSLGIPFTYRAFFSIISPRNCRQPALVSLCKE